MTYLGGPARGRSRRDLVLTAILLVAGVLMSALPGEQQSQVAAVLRATVLYPFLELHRVSAARAQIGRRAEVLESERDSLVELLSRYKTLADQSAELRDLAGLDSLLLGTVTPAEVYPGRPRVGDPDAFVLRGEALSELVFPVGVFVGRGLVGVARAPHGDGARGEFWTHPDFRVSVVTEDGSVTGIVRPFRPEGEQPVLLLDGAPFQSDIPEGTTLFTTGIASVYPPGIPVGRVRELAEIEAGWMKRYIVEPAVRPEEIGVVLVWLRPRLPRPEVP